MTKCTLVVLSNPVEGRDDEFNDWYNDQHLGDVLEVPGIVSASRLKLTGTPAGGHTWQYCALYDVEHDDPAAVLHELQARSGTGRMPISEAFDIGGVYAAIYSPIS